MLLSPTIYGKVDALDVGKLALKLRSGVVKHAIIVESITGSAESTTAEKAVEIKHVNHTDPITIEVTQKHSKESLVHMSRIELSIQSLLMKNPSDEEIINKLYSDTKQKGLLLVKIEFTISAHTNLILQEALLAGGKFDEYFGNALSLSQIAGNSFISVLLDHIQHQGHTVMSKFVDGVYTRASQKIQSSITATQSLPLPPPGIIYLNKELPGKMRQIQYLQTR